MTLTYPQNLLTEIYSCEWPYDLPPDFDQTLAYVLAGLSERERLFLDKYYRERQTYEQIGRAACVTRERIRQVIAKAVAKLRAPENIRYLEYGVSGVIRQASRLKKPVSDIPLEELDLSLRSYNCLKRAGISTLGGIAALTLDELKNVRALGRKSISEISCILTRHGLSFRKGGET